MIYARESRADGEWLHLICERDAAVVVQCCGYALARVSPDQWVVLAQTTAGQTVTVEEFSSKSAAKQWFQKHEVSVNINQPLTINGQSATVYLRENRADGEWVRVVGDDGTAWEVLLHDLSPGADCADESNDVDGADDRPHWRVPRGDGRGDIEMDEYEDVRLVWATPDAEAHMAWAARVSSTRQGTNPNPGAFIRQAVQRGHWSVLELANMCVVITTSLPIATQILRHRSLSFQQQSRRYDDRIGFVPPLPARLQQPRHRTGGEPADLAPADWWECARRLHDERCADLYHEALANGIAREQAREVLPQSLSTVLVANGTLRSWFHYCQQRLDGHTQIEHRLVAEGVRTCLEMVSPTLGELLR